MIKKSSRLYQTDLQFMHRAIELAGRGTGFVSPNPLVGAVFVKNGKIISDGFHKKFGGDHAEIVALKNAGKNKISLAGSTLYINLEPCIHSGKTPPCVPALIAAGISRVKIAMKDPNPLVSGRGISALRRAGIKVDVGYLEREAKALNEKFIKWMKTGMPFVSMKVAMSLDGKIATRTGDSKWITGEGSRKYVKRIRDEHDAILVGAGTVLKDNPVLKGKIREPLRVILDSKLTLPFTEKVFRNNNVFIALTSKAPQFKINALIKRRINFKIFKGEKIPLRPLLRFLSGKNISSVLVEGGSEIFGSAIDEKLVDKFYWFIAPKIIGGQGAKPAVGGKGVFKMAQAMDLKDFRIEKSGKDILVIANGSSLLI
ncbi:bifunctional diaminohydroxyphosphoribosylaminopyrimidine deaminase/5-amino-6-(5-phosphoribosylamino)uracil reductase RibD [Candidatus Peregrinibacteria bacterium]|nr:bifunctional diaminohydroxyphosphoribosylaminopyrimidine deaminase/5-amino-6-(5-phosphoribosylamino)uracil reductase RibD [Candidatus Peregrinibacteria bacterium]